MIVRKEGRFMKRLQDVMSFLESRFEHQIQAHRVLPAESGRFEVFPSELNPRLRDVLTAQGIASLYTHQAEAFGRGSSPIVADCCPMNGANWSATSSREKSPPLSRRTPWSWESTSGIWTCAC
jgi:hypothetical protein